MVVRLRGIDNMLRKVQKKLSDKRELNNDNLDINGNTNTLHFVDRHRDVARVVRYNDWVGLCNSIDYNNCILYS